MYKRQELGLGNRTNMIMQSAFFKLSKVIDLDDAVKLLKEAIVESYGTKGEAIVEMNNKAVDKGIEALVEIEVPAHWADAKEQETEIKAKEVPEFIENVLIPMSRQEGDSLPVSVFKDRADGTFPSGTSAYEKRGIALHVPEWQIDNCIQCNQCSCLLYTSQLYIHLNIQ